MGISQLLSACHVHAHAIGMLLSPTGIHMRVCMQVLIPTYTESLSIVKETATAAADALLPDKCKRTVYVLDDGKDPEKAAWVAEQGREDLVYRSGRVRAPGETNGKACNLNNTLRWLYPAEKNVADEEVSCA